MIIDSRYKVQSEMGRGPWSIVYRVRDMREGGEYALKLFDGVTSSELYAYFKPERMHHLMKIRHENLINIYDFGNFNQHIYYLSEFYQGYTLSRFTFTPVSMDLLYEIIVKVCYGLSALHSQNLVHQLLKPTNIGYKVENGKVEVKIMDYGFTKVDFRKSNTMGEYLPYIAPEIFQNNNATPQSDFFSLGVILYQITTNSLPFSVANMRQFHENPKLSIIPQFPRQINASIPLSLENLILQLLDMNPKERFGTAEEIISYINDTQPKKYAFSEIQSQVNKIQLSDYIVREEYSHQLLQHSKAVKQGSGKLIMLYAGKGMGKTDALLLFRYHLLTGDYFIFDYNCSAKDKDPFFALIKEFYHSVENNSKLQKNMCAISDRMNQYVFDNMDLIDNNNLEENLERDFIVASEFLDVLSHERPLIFTIRSCQYITPDVIEFLNYFSSNYLANLPIMIILSVNDPHKLAGLKHPVEMKMNPLNLMQTQEYVFRLLNEKPSPEFLRQLWQRSYGNPEFMEKILIDLTSRQIIWQKGKFEFDNVPLDYKLPPELIEAINLKMSHLDEWTYLKLIMLSTIRVPITHKLIRYVLNISDQELYFLLNDGQNNEILYEENSQVYFTYREAKERFISECEMASCETVSRQILLYFADDNLHQNSEPKQTLVPVDGRFNELDLVKTDNLLDYINDLYSDDEQTLQGLIEHSRLAGNFDKQRLYQKFLSRYYSNKKNFRAAFLSMVQVIRLDFDKRFQGSYEIIRDDIYILLEFANWIDLLNLPSDFARLIRRMPACFEKAILLGSFDFEIERNGRAYISFKKALDLADTELAKLRVLLCLGRYYVRMNKWDELQDIIEKLEKFEMTDEFEIIYLSLVSFNLSHRKKNHEAIRLINEYLQKQAGSTRPVFFVELGGLYINLGQFYNRERDHKKELDCYHTALEIWSSVGYERKLGIVYNNLGDIALRQGRTVKAFENFHNARLVSERANNRTSLILSYLNYGEAYIKQGDFLLAEENLKQAQDRSNRTETRKFGDAIIHNIAIARSKQNNFYYYRSFIAHNKPALLKNEYTEITPLEKTWFYYLGHIGNKDTLERLLNETGNLLNTQPEFYWQMQGNLHYMKKEYKDSLIAYENCLEYAKRAGSEYALAIVNLYLCRVNTLLGNIREALNHEMITRELCQKNKFKYWELWLHLIHQQIDLQIDSVNLRKIIRELNQILKAAAEYHYFLLELECYSLLCQIFDFLKKKRKSSYYRKLYRTKQLAAIEKIPADEATMFLTKRGYYQEANQQSSIKIASRTLTNNTDWSESLYELVKIKEPKRVPFLIQKIFNKIFAPYQIALVLKEQILLRQPPMLYQNIKLEELYSDAYLQAIKQCLLENRIIQTVIGQSHAVFVPLRIKSLQQGCLMLTDSGELNFQKYEIEILSFIRLHLTAMLMRGDEFHQLNERLVLMDKLIAATGNLFEVVSVKHMQNEITRSAIAMMNAVRGFFITQEGLGNYSFAVAIDETNNILDRFSHLGREVLARVAANKLPIFVNQNRNSDLVPQMASGRLRDLEIYAAPIIIDDLTYGYLYLDNANSKDRKLMINRDFTPLFLKLMTAMLRNAIRYQRLLEVEQKTDQLKDHKEKFIQIVSHELQQPVAVLRSLITIINNFQQPPELEEVVDSFNQTSNQLNDRINEIVEHFHFTNLEKLEGQKVDLREVIQAAKLRAEEFSKERRLYFNLDLPPKPLFAEIDVRVFNILLDKLLKNAIRYSMDLSITTIGLRSATTLAEKVQNMDSIVIYVQDEGIGIKPSELDNVFKEFYEVNDIYSHRSGDVEFNSAGLGLGLATARKIAELHGGKIWGAANDLDKGKGMTFYIALPLADKENKTIE
jgi:signal transduction histidine kinase/serine/threonine protein kinase